MSSVVISGDSSGAITLSAPAVAGTNTITLPAATGTVMVSGNMPAFSAYQSSAQSLTANTITKLQYQTEEFDTANCFDSTTNYRFTPTVAGYYQVNGAYVASTNRTYNVLYVYKNGSNYKMGQAGNNTSGLGTSVSVLVYLNGSTDYVELYGFTGVTQNTSANANETWFQAVLVRGA